MGDRGSVYYKPTGETTEWEDILINKGIIAPKTKVEEDVQEVEVEETENERRAKMGLDELDELDDEYDDDRALQRIREKRMAEMKMQASRNKFGSVYPITKEDWTREVNDSSHDNWVVAFLFDHAVAACKLMDDLITATARNHADVKFVRIPSQNCMENWPAKNLPTIFLYANGNLFTQLLTLRSLKGMDTSVEDLEQWLASQGVFRALPEAPKKQSADAGSSEEEDDSDYEY